MKKNVVWWPAIVNESHVDKYGGYNYFQYSKNTWEYWCKRNDCLFVPFTEPVEEDLVKYRVNWQKALFVFDELDKRNIEYDQICLVDSSFMARWDMPNFFEMTDRKFTACRDMDNMRWIYESIQGYKNMFDGFELDMSKYVNSGFMIFNESHKDLFQKFKEFYINNIDDFCKLQDVVVKKGNEQTPMNYWLQLNEVDMNIDLPLPFKITHLQRKELFSYNWQLDEDKTPFFIKYGYNYSFNGIPKDQRTDMMKRTWDLIKNNYTFNENELVLNSVNHKDTFKNATSRKFKSDLFEFFKDDKYKKMKVLELGACHGDTTRVFAELFDKVYAVDRSEDNVQLIREKCKDVDNVECSVMDVTNDAWNFPQVDVVFVDASHDYPQVAVDIQKCIDYFDNPLLILDDYGNPNNTNIRNSIDDKVREGKINIHKKIGEGVGFLTKSGWKMIDREGVICKV
tara:strand:+ start:21192 stop:22553 length:1362 start_codon:yes stop_codon:yes gene_type:complete